MPDRLNLLLLTSGERIWLWRRRRGLSLQAAGTHLGIGKNRLGEIERGKRSVSLNSKRFRKIVPTVPERLLLARRRWGKGLHGTARLAKVSHITLQKRERRGDRRLVRFWLDLGFHNLTAGSLG